MHPVLMHMRRLALYLFAWLPLAVLIAYLLASQGAMAWGGAAALSAPLCLIYAFVCLSAWYSCRMTPLETTGFFRLVLSNLLAAIIVAYFWVLIAKLIAYLLTYPSLFSGLERKLTPRIPLLFIAGVLLYLLSVSFHYVLISVELSRQAETRAIEAQILARDAELKALKAQINPHFLFNSLNSISALTTIDAARAREMCVLLSDFLRKTLGMGEKKSIALRDELALVERFLAVEKVRFGPRLSFTAQVDDAAQSCDVPPLVLQPLVENAVAHGVANLPDGGWIRLAAHRSPSTLTVVVENNFDPEIPVPRGGGGLGLTNVRERLRTSYGDRASLRVHSQDGQFRVDLLVPLEGDGQ